MDYWGLSYKQALDYILKNDSSQSLTLYRSNPPGILDIQNMYLRI